MLGDFVSGVTINFPFTTAVNGVPTTLAGTPAVSVYRDADAAQSVAGVTLTADFDGLAGLNLVSIDTSADPVFYADGHDYTVVITAGTVGGPSVVGTVVEDFSIINRSQALETTVDAMQLDITAIRAKTDNLPENVQRNTPLPGFMFLMVSSANHVSGATGLAVTATRNIDNTGFAACANGVTEIGFGVYVIDLDASDLNGNVIMFRFTAAGADDRFITIKTAP